MIFRNSHKGLNLFSGRFTLAHDWLTRCSDCTEGILFTDFRDVFFQADPFLNVVPRKLILFAESPLRSTTHWTVQHPVSTCFNASFRKPILSIGTVMGNRQGISKFLTVYGETQSKMLKRPRCHTLLAHFPNGADQAVLNYIYYSSLLPEDTKVVAHREGPVHNVGVQGSWIYDDHVASWKARGKNQEAANREEFYTSGNKQQWISPAYALIDEDGRFTQADGSISALVHQWDRLGPGFIERVLTYLPFMQADVTTSTPEPGQTQGLMPPRNRTDAVPIGQQGNESWFCPQQAFDTKRWLAKRKHVPFNFDGCPGSTVPETLNVPPTWFCDKLPQDVSPWQAPTRYTSKDMAVGVYTGESIVYSRGLAIQDTWLSQGVAAVLYSPTTLPDVPTVGFEHLGELPDYENPTAAHTVQLYGLADLYHRHPDKAWYYIVGCDTYLNVDFALSMLDTFDAKDDWWLSKVSYPYENFTVPVNRSAFPRYDGNGFTWSSGAYAWFLSNPVAKAYAEALDTFTSQMPTVAHSCYCPDKVTGMLLSLLGHKITNIPDPWNAGYDHCAVDGKQTQAPSLDVKRSHYHYLTPVKMMAVHQRALHEKLDRMIVAGMHQELERWKVVFSEMHVKVVRRKLRQLEDLCGGPQAVLSLTTLEGSMRERIEAHMTFLRLAQSIIGSLVHHTKKIGSFRPYDIALNLDIIVCGNSTVK
ncbi:hypothetical protein CYMTET_56576 [Cymbomonas tetramitiformis]|uniref:Fringe-like glycosyltransferase domain-containing protein n=1 Tax=Cymbomonas tetramitiformis TaxID=36881 RepID=A0AAE0ELU0_9CHLO|nr:hypothetical protein CYMTET_56576 [Cymbomonas tetramitiformis]|eukprot:gene19691-23553_t